MVNSTVILTFNGLSCSYQYVVVDAIPGIHLGVPLVTILNLYPSNITLIYILNVIYIHLLSANQKDNNAKYITKI